MKRRSTRLLLSFTLLAGAAAMSVCNVGYAGPASPEWSSWRGPGGTGVSLETGLPSQIKSRLLWKQPLGGGRSTPVVFGGHVYLVTRAGSGLTQHESVMCFDAETGKVLWKDPINVFHTTIPGPRVGWSKPVVDTETGNVYFHGIQGIFKCYRPDGTVVWRRSLTEEFGRISGYGGRTNTPVIDEDIVILSFLNASWGSQGRGSHRYVAFDKKTGSIRWWSAPGGKPLDTTYSTPVVAMINGVRQLIVGCADGWIYGLEVRTGKKIWGYHLSKRGINVSPVVSGHHVYIGHSEENVDATTMGRVVCLDARGEGDISKSGLVWEKDELPVGYSSPAFHDDVLYVVDNSANLHAFNAKTGKDLWEHSIGVEGKASPVIADGKMYIGEVRGKFHILEASGKGCRSLDSAHFVRQSDNSNNEIFGSCAVANGRVYLPTRDFLMCFGDKGSEGKAVKAAAAPKEASAEGTRPATVLVTPAEVLLNPGETVKFAARLYNDKGQYLGDEKDVTWSLASLPGSINASGEYGVSTAHAVGPLAGEVRVSVGGLSGAARVRVVPALPMKLDFTNVRGKVPSGWIGVTPIRFKITEIDGRPVLNKHGKSQRFARALAFVGPPDLDNYTIQSDIRGNFRRRAFSDIGLVNQRYRLALMGGVYNRKTRGMKDQVLRVLTWVAEKRLQKDVPFKWEKDTWYTMKFRVEPKGDKALIRGKVWPRDTAEPEAWTVEVEDPFPHKNGSPGIYAYSSGTTSSTPGTDAFFDNIIITQNNE